MAPANLMVENSVLGNIFVEFIRGFPALGPWGLRFDYSLGDLFNLFAELRWIFVWNSQGHFQGNPTNN